MVKIIKNYIPVLLIIMLFFLGYYIINKIGEDKVEYITSKSYKLTHQKLNVITNFIDIKSEIIDMDFILYSHALAMGPDVFNYRIVIKVTNENIDKWIEGYKPISKDLVPVDIENWISDKKWVHNSKAEYYSSGNNFTVVYRREGIIYIWIKSD